MIVVTTEKVAGYRVCEVKGPVFGVVVRARGLGGDIMAFFVVYWVEKLKEYTAMLEDADEAGD